MRPIAQIAILGDVFYVAASGPNIADDPSHGSDSAPWRTLQHAVDQLTPGDTLMVRRGYYNQHVTIRNDGTSTEPITIRSEVPHSAKVNGGLTIDADYITVYGLDVEQPFQGTGFDINGVVGTEVLNNRAHDCPLYGIRVASPSASGFQIRNNVVSCVGQIGVILNGSNGLVEGNRVMEVVAYHPKHPAAIGDDADGMLLRGDGHVIRRNLLANYADPLDTHNYDLQEPTHNAHADCFDTRELNNTVVEGNYCWSGFHVSKGLIFNGSSIGRSNITADCDNRIGAGMTGNPIIITGGSGTSDYNFSWNSDGSVFVGATPGDNGSLTLDPEFESYDTAVHGRNDYRLNASSALIGLGTDGLYGTGGEYAGVNDDIDGLARPQDFTFEPGPHEYQPG